MGQVIVRRALSGISILKATNPPCSSTCGISTRPKNRRPRFYRDIEVSCRNLTTLFPLIKNDPTDVPAQAIFQSGYAMLLSENLL
ncbi:MAG TPA: hypothetical protein VE170_00645, partial [Candidatus Limnocylindria bacterium]|nr:hypothetical protein [Candidatus Limnocylindria bacterium]